MDLDFGMDECAKCLNKLVARGIGAPLGLLCINVFGQPILRVFHLNDTDLAYLTIRDQINLTHLVLIKSIILLVTIHAL